MGKNNSKMEGVDDNAPEVPVVDGLAPLLSMPASADPPLRQAHDNIVSPAAPKPEEEPEVKESPVGGDVIGDMEETARIAQERDKPKEEPKPKVEASGQLSVCSSCNQDIESIDFYELEICGHGFCVRCLYNHSKVALEEKAHEIDCPLCKVNVSLDDLKKALDAFGEKKASEDLAAGASLRRSMHQPDQRFPVSLTESLECFIVENQNFIRCPNSACGLVFERIQFTKRDPRPEENVKDENGNVVSPEALDHYFNNRFRCRHCSTVFCAQCNLTPYHIGKTCRQYVESLQSKKCRFCGDKVQDGAHPYKPNGYQEHYIQRWRRKRTEEKRRKQFDNLTRSRMQSFIDKFEAELEAAGDFYVCELDECKSKAEKSCLCVTPCHHLCGGVRGEKNHLRCLKPQCCPDPDSQTADDYCNICWVEPLGAAPTVELSCGHYFHYHCIEHRLLQGPGTPYISFKYANCPLCQVPIDHECLRSILVPIRQREQHVRELATQRLKIEEGEADDALKEGGEFYRRPADYAMRIFAFYECYQCGGPFYGGRKRCDPGANAEDDEAVEAQDRRQAAPERLCSGCCGIAAKCKTHGTDYIEFKCRFCCAIATYFCGGACHYCTPCHDKASTLTNFSDWSTKWDCGIIKECEGPHSCPLAIHHAKNGEEFSLGCAMCRAEQKLLRQSQDGKSVVPDS
eukprot:TRINITY_DN2430_c0_g1_i1.p1 TRINITY_DN2430_c0_g1~~TRINITY_DN2430_c0_g1_i1.p1  ORF type:complete len:685 (+),score=256.80 TRINITY_DN2430_c0_g1_i1:184-2238(+)